ncbi:unnamed protein product [Diabrotica balteata]|uniref:C2H2-type domain-containing protein n=1 Tax=Diabrotica balteata TaxID=107213 RepID=A0A9N9SY38_DIABA|nr:unnamed protein product [Diabrotica balteata]
MGTQLLKCPLCCNEHFSSRQDLKCHITELLNSLSCPVCTSTFNSVIELSEHLDTECELSEGVSNQNEDESVSEIHEHSEQMLIQLDETQQEPTNEHVEMVNDDTQQIEFIESEDIAEEVEENGNVIYECEVCKVQFNSIKNHLKEYHAGEDVVLQTNVFHENELSHEMQVEEDQVTEYSQEEESFEISHESGNDENEKPVIQKNNKRVDWVSRKDNVIPLTENYAIENGKVRKITEKEAAEISDRNSIFQIHQCPKCFLQFPKLDHYIKHKCSAGKKSKQFKCAHCTAVFLTYPSLNTHLKLHLQPQPEESQHKVITLNPHRCNTCNTLFPSLKSLRLHLKMHEPVKIKPVEPPVDNDLADGEKKERKIFVCHICNNPYDLEYEQVHMKSHSEEKNFFCTTCNREFMSQENLEMHMKAHNSNKNYICSYCKKAYTTSTALEDHEVNHCLRRKYECQYCGRRFSRPHEKVKHERIHTGEKPHICQVCGKGFRVSYCLTLHMRTHSGSRPYECPKCQKRFKSHSVYNHHLLIHSEVRAYKCPYCPKAFKTSVQLAGHKNSHIKPFSCNECNRPFASLYAVRAHMESHKRENNLKFDCWLCGATYARAFALKDHMKSQHADENVDAGALGELETEETVFVIKEDLDEKQEV